MRLLVYSSNDKVNPVEWDVDDAQPLTEPSQVRYLRTKIHADAEDAGSIQGLSFYLLPKNTFPISSEKPKPSGQRIDPSKTPSELKLNRGDIFIKIQKSVDFSADALSERSQSLTPRRQLSRSQSKDSKQALRSASSISRSRGRLNEPSQSMRRAHTTLRHRTDEEGYSKDSFKEIPQTQIHVISSFELFTPRLVAMKSDRRSFTKAKQNGWNCAVLVGNPIKPGADTLTHFSVAFKSPDAVGLPHVMVGLVAVQPDESALKDLVLNASYELFLNGWFISLMDGTVYEKDAPYPRHPFRGYADTLGEYRFMVNTRKGTFRMAQNKKDLGVAFNNVGLGLEVETNLHLQFVIMLYTEGAKVLLVS